MGIQDLLPDLHIIFPPDFHKPRGPMPKTTTELREELTQVKARVTALEADIQAKEQQDLQTQTINDLRTLADDLYKDLAWIDRVDMKHERDCVTIETVSISGKKSLSVLLSRPVAL